MLLMMPIMILSIQERAGICGFFGSAPVRNNRKPAMMDDMAHPAAMQGRLNAVKRLSTSVRSVTQMPQITLADKKAVRQPSPLFQRIQRINIQERIGNTVENIIG
jgi:hypothetical protein